MSNLTYETQGTNTYLVYEILDEDVVDSMSLGMLTNNKIPGLAQTFFTQINNKKIIRYNVSSHISVAQFFTGAVNKKRLLGVFSGIVDAMLSAEDYMININSILLDLEHIYADVTSCESVLICLPIENAELNNPDIGAFFKQIMFGTQFDQTENCDHVAKIINYLNASPVFSLEEFKKLLDEIKNEKKSTSVVTKAKEEPKIEPVSNQQKQPTVPQTKLVAAQSGTPGTDVSRENSGTAVKTTPTQSTQVPQTSVQEDAVKEKGMSWFYLMQHYNKENAAAYKAQKKARKKGTAAQKAQAPAMQPAQKKPVTPNTLAGFGFAVPGQPAPAQQSAATNTAPAQQNVQPKVNPAPTTATTPDQQPAYVPRQVPQGQAANFGETTVLNKGNIGETTVLNTANAPAQMIAPHLIRKKNNEKISLNKPVFRIGKERSYVDYFIGDNTAISRSHANVITREGTYFIVDTNSTNHTFVNGTMINSNEEVQINHGDSIRLANEDFDFKLY